MSSNRQKRVKDPKSLKALDKKIYKTGQTRGADDDEIFQNRVGRTSTVLIPYNCLDKCLWDYQSEAINYENGFIVLIPPKTYFNLENVDNKLGERGIYLGRNALVFYETRADWDNYHPDKMGWNPAANRKDPLQGQYVARIPATTSVENGGKILKGFNTTSLKGAGIRVYEYADKKTISDCRFQLEAIFWMCSDAIEVAALNGMSMEDASIRREWVLNQCCQNSLLDVSRLQSARILNQSSKSICPLCLKELEGKEFFSKMSQAEGREVSDLTVTQANLFHIKELRHGELNHQPYNLGWGHHHCNIVVKDSGIFETLRWMNTVVKNNISQGFVID
jgi:hypothetical protein